MKKGLVLVLGLVCLALMLRTSANAFEKQKEIVSGSDKVAALVDQYAEAINGDDIDGYSALFTEDNQRYINADIRDHGKVGRFHEESVKVINSAKLSDELVGSRAGAGLTYDETSKYRDIVVYYTELLIEMKDEFTNEKLDILDSGYAYRLFIMVKENGDWKILRVSSPDVRGIVEAGEGFGTQYEQLKGEAQSAK